MIILTDCDGVLLDWAQSYHGWMKRKGYELVNPNEYAMDKCYNIPRAESKALCRAFSESAAIGFVPPLRDAIKYVRKLHEEHGAVFHCITSLSDDAHAIKLREQNLDRIFGEGVFEKVVCLDAGADKDEALEEYRDSHLMWIEDKKANADLGVKMGLQSYLLAHPYNADYSGRAMRVSNWREIYEIVNGR